MKTLRKNALAYTGMIAATLVMLTTSAFTSPDQPASFGTTQTDLKEYVSENLEYPKDLVESGYEVQVNVLFWVDKFGKVLNTEVGSSALKNEEKTITEVEMSQFESAAVEVINNMPKWTPAIINGNQAPVQYKLPILFKTT